MALHEPEPEKKKKISTLFQEGQNTSVKTQSECIVKKWKSKQWRIAKFYNKAADVGKVQECNLT